MTRTLRALFVLAALLVVLADGVLLGYAHSLHESLQVRLAREAVEEAKRLVVEREEGRSWREYAPYIVPADALAAEIVLVRSPLADLQQGIRASFALEHQWAGADAGRLRLRSPWFTDGAAATDPDDLAADEKRRRFARVRLLEPLVVEALGHSTVQDAAGVQRDSASPEVIYCQVNPLVVQQDINESQNGNAVVQEKLRKGWNDSQMVSNSYRSQQSQQAQQEQVAPPPAKPGAPPPGYEVHVSLFSMLGVRDPERRGRAAVVLARKVRFVAPPGARLPPLGPYYQCFEVDDSRLATTDGVSSWDSMRSTRALLNGAAALIFLVGTGGLYLLYAAVASRLDMAQRRTEFAAAVSHELKAPLAGIRALAEMMHEGMVTSPEKTKEYVGNILHESERLSRLIGNVLDAARLERRERTYAVAPGDPAPAIREAIEIFRTHLLGRGFELAIDVPESLPAVPLDRDALVQALANLIDNAAKYTAPCAVRRLAVHARARPRDVAIEVEDSGIGIDPSERARIFEPFRRGRDPLARGTGGAGLGLPIALSHVKAMRGRIEVEGEKGKGSVFRVVLPREERLGPP